MVNLKSASFIVIMLLHEGLTHIHSQKSLGCFLVRVSLQAYFLKISADRTANETTEDVFVTFKVIQ